MTSLTLRLPTPTGELETYTVLGTPVTPTRTTPARSRVAYAAAHVVADPLGSNGLGSPPSSTGTPPSPSGTTCGTRAWSPTRWTPPSAGWG